MMACFDPSGPAYLNPCLGVEVLLVRVAVWIVLTAPLWIALLWWWQRRRRSR